VIAELGAHADYAFDQQQLHVSAMLSALLVYTGDRANTVLIETLQGCWSKARAVNTSHGGRYQVSLLQLCEGFSSLGYGQETLQSICFKQQQCCFDGHH